MDDLISRQAAIDAVEFGITYARAFNKETGEVKELFQDSNDELREAVERIKQLPPIQPEIVRCKDCQDYQTDWNPRGKTGRHYCETMDSFMLPDEFCCYAERKEQDG